MSQLVQGNADISALLALLDIEGEDAEETTEVLMNTALQSLGALKLYIADRRAHVRSRRCSALQDDDTDSVVLEFKTQVFCDALRTFAVSLESDDQTTAVTTTVTTEATTVQLISPATTQLLESFPDESSLGQPRWGCLAWRLLQPSLDPASLPDILRRRPQLCAERDKFGRPPLSYAAALASPAAFTALLAFDTTSSALLEPSSLGCLPLHSAARYSPSVEVLDTVLRACPAAVQHADSEECLPLHLAARYSPSGPPAVRLLLDHYPEAVRVWDAVGRYALHHAAIACGSTEVFRVLAAAAPEMVRTYTSFGRLALHVAAVFNPSLDANRLLHELHPAAVKLATIPHGRLPLHESVWFCHNPAVVQYYLAVYPEAAALPTSEGHTPLHFLLDTPHMTPARMLCLHLLLRANPAAAFSLDNEGESPFSVSRKHGHGGQVIRLLLRAVPAREPPLLRELNWQARRAAVLTSVLHDLTQQTTTAAAAAGEARISSSNSTGAHSTVAAARARDTAYGMLLLSRLHSYKPALWQDVIRFL